MTDLQRLTSLGHNLQGCNLLAEPARLSYGRARRLFDAARAEASDPSVRAEVRDQRVWLAEALAGAIEDSE